MKAKAIFAAIIAVIITAGCAGQQAAPNPTDAPASQAPAAAVTEQPKAEAPPSEEPTAPDAKLSITWWGSQTRHDYTQTLLDLYSSNNPGISFEASPSGWDGYFDKLSTQAASGALPDIIQMDYLYLATYAKNNTLADLLPYADSGALSLGDVDENLYSSGFVDGKLSGLVLSSSVVTFPYNPAVLSEAGVSEPTVTWTWDDFIAICQQVKEKTGKYGLSSNPIDTNILNYYIRQSGSPLFAPDNKSLGYSDDSAFAGFAQLYKTLVDSGAAPTPDEWTQINALGKEASPVATGDAAFTTEWSNFGVIVAAVNPDIKLAVPPYSSSGNKALWIKPGMFFSVAQTSKLKDEAVKFIDWFINSEEANAIIMAERGVPVSSKIRSYLKTSLNKQQQDMFDYIDLITAHSTQAPPPDPQGISEVNKLLIDTIDQVLYGRITPDEAAKNFRSEADAILARNN
ncbi:MAG: sugar ABC transporter substrate-binding protein [Clostridiales bacterium]|jgi:multiple sugar transport system substrate-binding protein|nr:sugar ABC transporter substrate-binding protein [Clostridiales bacterium]MDR2750975.1 sugar ABC transporter substrate-binding protein [Clostridiales bacterium]